MTQAPSIKEALEPCPLCSGTNLMFGTAYVEPQSKEPAVRCCDCGCRATLKAWNARATFQPDGERREAIARAIAAYNEVWNGWPELEAKNVDECREEAMKAALLASGLVQNEAGIPDGYVLAPIEPTETMLAACEESKPENAKTERRRILATRLRDEGRSIRRADYRAMISAIRSARDGGES